jgi:hypothetical protein
MKKQLLVLISLFALVIIVAGCVQQPPAEEKQKQAATEISKETCTAGLKCKDAFTKAYQDANCNWTQITDCQYGCENNDCKVPADAMDKIEAAIEKALSK